MAKISRSITIAEVIHMDRVEWSDDPPRRLFRVCCLGFTFVQSLMGDDIFGVQSLYFIIQFNSLFYFIMICEIISITYSILL